MTIVLDRPLHRSPHHVTDSTRREFVFSAALVGLGGLAACSTDSGTGSDGVTGTDSSASTTGSASSDGERVIVLGEEYLLADLLALGITPTASTATVPEAGFQGLDDYDTSGIEILPGTEPNLERLASLAPTRIITTQFFVDELGKDRLDALADVTVLPDAMTPDELVTTYGDLFGRRDAATALVTRYDDARTRATEALGGLQVSVASVYPGPSVAAFVAGPTAVPTTLLDAGATLVPDAEAAPPDRNGRAYLSMERIELLSAPQMVLQQSSLVDGEGDALEQVQQNSLWTSLPAVAADEVVQLDRLAYPGIEGRIRLIDDLIAAFG